MKTINWKPFLPHVIAIAIFLVISLIYCKPALEGKVLQQHDISQWKGAIQNSVEYAKNHNGKYPLWSNGLFCGMPAYQIGGISGNVIGGYATTVMTLWLPKPVNFFFLACLCFYILCCCLRVNPWTGIIGALAFAYATYDPVIISVGHDTKMWAIALMPAVLGSVILIFDKRYLWGFVLTALFTSMLISVNHLQIAYYLFLTIGVMAVFFLVRLAREKRYRDIMIMASLAIGAVLIGVLTNAEALFGTYEYQKETIRGGGSALSDSTRKSGSKPSTGLDKDYGLAYSMGITEPFVLMVPRLFGGSSDKEEVSQDKSKAVEALGSLPRELQSLQNQLPLSYYWGGIQDVGGSTGTSGPPYVGAIICFLAIFSMFILDRKHKWWIFTAIMLTIIMSWGIYFDGFNSFLFNHLPFYNKFRAPSMIMVIPQLLLPLLAVLGIDKMMRREDKKTMLKLFFRALMVTGIIFVFLFLCYMSYDFLSSSDKNILKQVRASNQPPVAEAVKSFFNGLKEDRQGLMMGDIFRSIGFILLGAAMVFMFLKNIIKPWIIIAGLAIFAFVDVALINSTYLNSSNYQEKDEEETTFNATPKDQEILADKSDYRVFNMSGNRWNENNTSYLYKSIGGYHPAKLRIYQDLIEHQLSNQEPNMGVLNMLNAKYFIQKDRNGATQQVQKNDSALGSCWFVKQVVFVKDLDEEMKALDKFNPKDTAFVEELYKNAVPFLPGADSSSSIKLVKNDNDVINYQSISTANQFAVFSEIYYNSGWKAYVDGKEAPIAKVDYVLRGLAINAGKHDIEFRFEPAGYLTGRKLNTVFNIILALLLLGAVLIRVTKLRNRIS